MDNEIEVARKVTESTRNAEEALINQVIKYRLGNNSSREFKAGKNSPSTKKALISACLIPIGSFIAAGFAIYFGHKALAETQGNRVRGRSTAIFSLLAGYITIVPLCLLALLSLIH